MNRGVKIKFKFIFMVIIFAVISLSGVYATDLTNSSNSANFTQLNIEINDSNEILNLNNDYYYVEGDTNVYISKSIIIDGKWHSLKGNSSTIIFNINENFNVVFVNIKFVNNDHCYQVKLFD